MDMDMVKHKGKRYGSYTMKYKKSFSCCRNNRKAFLLQKEECSAAEKDILGILSRIFLTGTCCFFSQYLPCGCKQLVISKSLYCFIFI